MPLNRHAGFARITCPGMLSQFTGLPLARARSFLEDEEMEVEVIGVVLLGIELLYFLYFPSIPAGLGLAVVAWGVGFLHGKTRGRELSQK